jgi:hypothetical protein
MPVSFTHRAAGPSTHCALLVALTMLGAGATVRDAGAQRVIRETAAQWSAAPRLPVTLERRWCMDGDAQGCDFRDIAQAFALDDGGILATDAMGPLRRFGADGALVRTLGRRGQGPGEYGFVFQPQVTTQGRVAWFDNTQMRIATITLDGTPGPVTRLLPPPTMASMHLVGEELVILDVPATAPRGEPVDASYRTVPAAGPPRVLARVRTPSLFDPGSDLRPMSGPFAVRVVADVGTAGDVVHGNGTAYDLLGFPSSGAPRGSRITDGTRSWVLVVERDRDDVPRVSRHRVGAPGTTAPGR